MNDLYILRLLNWRLRESRRDWGSFHAILTDKLGLFVCRWRRVKKNKEWLKHYFLVLDIDECADEYENDCDPNAVCTNTEGSYICQCYRGFEGDGQNCTGQLKLTFQYFSKVILINFVKIHFVRGKWRRKFNAILPRFRQDFGIVRCLSKRNWFIHVSRESSVLEFKS